MASHDMEKISCKNCKKEIPRSAKVMREGSDYEFYFCNIKCQEAWKKNNKHKNLSEIIANPEKFYQAPTDVLNDNEIYKETKLKILSSWEHDAIELQRADEENMGNGEQSILQDIKKAILQLQEKK